MKTALSIAGTDPTGGAGSQADAKAMTMNGVFALSVITAVLAQNTMGVRKIVEMSPEFLKEQLDCVFEDIEVDAVKIGMVSSVDLIDTIAASLQKNHAKHIVVDPVMVATSGDPLISQDAIETLKSKLLILAEVITPNIPEAQILWGHPIHNEKDMEKAAKEIGEMYNCSVLLKGGHSINDANDYLYSKGKGTWFYGKRIENPNTHGTGCTLSSAIAANMAKGYSLEKSIELAKSYLSKALEAMLDLGHGKGPMQHNFNLTGEFSKAPE